MKSVVLLPGIGTTSATWDGVIAALDARLNVVRHDWPGHDGTPVPPAFGTLTALADGVLATIGDEPVDIVGLSLGGMVGLYLAAAYPARVRRLVVICTNLAADPRMFLERAAIVRSAGMSSVAARSVDGWVGRPDPHLTTMIETVDPEGYAQCCEAIANLHLDPEPEPDLDVGPDPGFELRRVAAPTLLIAGTDDPSAPPAVMRSLAHVVGATYAEVPGRHLAIVESPRAVARLVLGHLGDGMAVRREVLGDAHVDRAVAATDPLTADFQDFLTRYAWGEVWTRPGLGRRDRSLVTLGVLVALGAEAEIAMHVRAAIRNGLTSSELAEVLHHTALYAGLPRANAAFAIARRVLAEMEDE